MRTAAEQLRTAANSCRTIQIWSSERARNAVVSASRAIFLTSRRSPAPAVWARTARAASFQHHGGEPGSNLIQFYLVVRRSPACKAARTRGHMRAWRGDPRGVERRCARSQLAPVAESTVPTSDSSDICLRALAADLMRRSSQHGAEPKRVSDRAWRVLPRSTHARDNQRSCKSVAQPASRGGCLVWFSRTNLAGVSNSCEQLRTAAIWTSAASAGPYPRNTIA